jgi:hypothetical protein
LQACASRVDNIALSIKNKKCKKELRASAARVDNIALSIKNKNVKKS